jgi:hypothetical protein
MDFWLLYLITRTEDVADALNGMCGVSVGALAVLFFVRGMMAADTDLQPDGYETIAKRMRSACRTLVAVAVVCGLLSTLMPTRKDWYMIIGGYAVTHIEGIDKLPANVVGAANEFLKRYQEESAEEEPKATKQGGGA